MALELSSLVVKPFERAEFFRSPQFCFLDRRFQHLNGLVVDAERHRKRMPVLSAVGDGESCGNDGQRTEAYEIHSPS